MEPKLIVYTVLAITLGYVFVSTIPSQLAPQMFEVQQPEGGLIRDPNSEQPSSPEEILGQTGDEILGDIAESSSAAAASDAAEAAAESANAASSGLAGYFPVFGTLIVNLTIALVVYWLAKRRFA